MWSATNSDAPTTLQYMANYPSKDNSTFLSLFKPGYGDGLIMEALNDNDVISNKELTLRLLQTIVTPQFAFHNFLESMSSCKSGAFNLSAQSWDIGSAIILGSMPRGSDTSPAARFRTTWYSLAQEMCRYFGCNSILVNSFSWHLGLGKSAINSKNCSALQQPIDTLKSLMFVPLIQPPMPLASRPNLLAADVFHVLLCCLL